MSRPSFNNPDYEPPEEEPDEYGIDEYDYRQDRANEVTGHPKGIDAAEAAFERSIDEGLRRMERLFGKEWLNEGALQEKMMGPDHSKSGIFVHHRCWRCNDGEKSCVNGSPNRCDYPRARND